MGYPPQQPHDPYGQQPGQSGPQYPQQPPVPYQQPYPPPAQGYGPPPYGAPQHPAHVQQVGRSVTKPAWTVGDIMWIVCTCGLAWPIVWAKRRSRTTITRHR